MLVQKCLPGDITTVPGVNVNSGYLGRCRTTPCTPKMFIQPSLYLSLIKRCIFEAVEC